MSVEFTPLAREKRATHLKAGHEMGVTTEQEHLGVRYSLTYCECGFEFIEYPTLREARP